jgi:hypothetical protein
VLELLVRLEVALDINVISIKLHWQYTALVLATILWILILIHEKKKPSRPLLIARNLMLFIFIIYYSVYVFVFWMK